MAVLCLLLFVALVAAASVVDLSKHTGHPKNLASGLLYGVPNTPGQIPDHFYTDMGLNYLRGGGTHLPDGEGGLGWNTGLSDYEIRMASTMSNYKTARTYGASFIILTSDLWGADGGESPEGVFPGDNGNWTNYDNFLTQIIADIKSNHATRGLNIDIWNEPDLSYAWPRNQSQYFEMWGRGYARLRKDLPGVVLTGPTLAGSPDFGNDWWTNFCSFVKTNRSSPDQWVWHMEPGEGDIMSTQATMLALWNQYGLSPKPININEYATPDQQTPVYSAWYIAQLERVNAQGLRGIWLSAAQVFDLFGGLLSKPNADNINYSATAGGYYPTGQYQVYKYYHQNMTGHRISTLPSSDHTTEVYATLDSTNRLKILYGSRAVDSASYISISSLSSIGLPTSGTLNITIYGFPFPSGSYGEVDAPVSIGIGTQTYSGDIATFPVYPADSVTAYAFEIQGTL